MERRKHSRNSGRARNASGQPKRADRKRSDVSLAAVRSAVTNGTALIHGVDQRSAWMRRLRDLVYGHEADLGGAANISQAQRSLIRRAAMLELQLEMLEARFAANDGEASPRQLDDYARTAGGLRRILADLGLHQGRAQRDVTPPAIDATNRVIDGIRATGMA